MASKFVDPASLPTMTFDWGVIKPLVASDNTEGTAVSMMHVILLPGKGHDRHNHPDADEILYILAGEGDQMVDDGDTAARPPRRHGLHPEGRVPLDDQHRLRADGHPRDLRAGGRRAGPQDAAGLRRGGSGRGARSGPRLRP